MSYSVVFNIVLYLKSNSCMLDNIACYSSFFQVMLGSLLALVHAHKQCLTIDKEAIAAYDLKLKEERKRADDQVRIFNVQAKC